MQKIVYILMLLTFFIYAEVSCDGVNIDKIKKLYAQETKEMVFGYKEYDKEPICQQIPSKENQFIVVLPYRGKLDNATLDEGYWLSLILAVVDTKSNTVVNHYFHKNIMDSSAVAIVGLELDTQKYVNLSPYAPFAITLNKATNSHTIFYEEEHLFLYEFRENRAKILLNNYLLDNINGFCEDYDLCGTNHEKAKIDAPHSKNYTPIMVEHRYWESLRLPSLGDTLYIDSKKSKAIFSKLVYVNGEYKENKYEINSDLLAIKGVLNGAKLGKNYTRFQLAKLLYGYYAHEEGTLAELNDIAYYLEKYGHNKEAVLMLESLLKTYPKRTVAYYNLGDAYWALGQKKKAKKMYAIYVKQMESRGKGKRVPEVVRERMR